MYCIDICFCILFRCEKGTIKPNWIQAMSRCIGKKLKQRLNLKRERYVELSEYILQILFSLRFWSVLTSGRPVSLKQGGKSEVKEIPTIPGYIKGDGEYFVSQGKFQGFEDSSIARYCPKFLETSLFRYNSYYVDPPEHFLSVFFAVF